MTVAADGEVVASPTSTGRWCCNHAKLAYNSVAAWLEGERPAPPTLAAVPGLDEQLRLQDRVAQAMRSACATGAGALGSTRSRRGRSSTTTRSPTCAPDETNRAKELIEDFMVAANGVAARFLAEKGIPSLRRVLRTPEALGPHRRSSPRELGERLPPTPDAVALERSCDRRRRGDPERFPDLSLSVVKLLGSGEYALERPGQRTRRGTSGSR